MDCVRERARVVIIWLTLGIRTQRSRRRLGQRHPERVSVDGAPLELHDVARQRPSLVGKNVLHQPQVGDDGAPGGGGRVRLGVVHSQVPGDEQYHHHRDDLYRHVRAQRDEVAQQRDEHEGVLQEVGGGGPPGGTRDGGGALQVEVGPVLVQVRVESRVPQLVERGGVLPYGQGSQGADAQEHDAQDLEHGAIDEPVELAELGRGGHRVHDELGVGAREAGQADRPIRVPKNSAAKQDVLGVERGVLASIPGTVRRQRQHAGVVVHVSVGRLGGEGGDVRHDLSSFRNSPVSDAELFLLSEQLLK
mmetsp:Transcript_49639/g.105511  ORF Transcript_49639/g.105511 Transcript_49639/m.105511 type:complete len:305 (-) Transcript_49639:1148-2062(-)